MADSFFKFQNSVSGLDDEFADLEEEEYDALNDETFGADAYVSDNWEETHTRLAAATEISRGRNASLCDEADENQDELDVEQSLNRLVLDDEPIPHTRKPEVTPVKRLEPWPILDHSSPILIVTPQIGRIPTVEELERRLIDKKQPPRIPLAPSGNASLGLGTTTNKTRSIASNHAPPGLFPRPSNSYHPTSPPQTFPTSLSSTSSSKPPGYSNPPFVAAPHDRSKNKPAGKSVMGMYQPPQGILPHPMMSPDMLLMRNQQEKIGFPFIHAPPTMGFPLMPPRMVPQNMMRYISPGRHLFPPMNSQMRHDGYMPQGNRNNFHPLLQQMNHHQQNQMWAQKQMNQQQHAQLQQQLLQSNRKNSNFDEYAKLMNNRDRIWLLNVQMMQLASDKPHIDDYYYTMWKKKNPSAKRLRNGFHQDNGRKKPEPFFPNNRPSEFTRERKDSEGTSASPRVYVPLQFENSLGKLQCGSVTAPRMIIDIAIMTEPQNGVQPALAQKDYRKTKKNLLELERLYLILMEAEEAIDNKDGNSETNPTELINKVLVAFLNEERYLSFLCIRKGKMLLLRCLAHVTEWDSSMFCDLWARMLKSFPTVLRRDRDDVLIPKFYPFFKKWADSTSWPNLLTVARSLLTATRDGRTSVLRASPSPSKPVLFYVLSNQFGISAVAKLLLQGEMSTASLKENETTEWKTFVEELVKSVANLENLDNVAGPIDPIPHNILTAILNRQCPMLSPHVHATAKKLLSS